MSLVIIAPNKRNTDFWQRSLRQQLANMGLDVSVEIWPQVEKPEEVLMAVTWKHPVDSLYAFPHLQLISSMGAGVDHILKDKNLPLHWQVVRIVDKELTTSMSNYLLAAVLNYHKQIYEYIALQGRQEWGYTETPERQLCPGILGLGELGQDIGQKLKQLGFEVAGFSRSPKAVEGLETFSGASELPYFLRKVNLLICLLPLTPQTKDFLNWDFFSQCKPGTYLINVARGEHLVEEDLIRALDEGLLAGATLDVFRQEPLPAEHPFWKHPKIIITPHIASVTKPEAAIPQVAENYRRLVQQEALVNKVDRFAGY